MSLQGQATGRTDSLSGCVQGREGRGSLIRESGSKVVIPSHDILSPKGMSWVNGIDLTPQSSCTQAGLLACAGVVTWSDGILGSLAFHCQGGSGGSRPAPLQEVKGGQWGRAAGSPLLGSWPLPFEVASSGWTQLHMDSSHATGACPGVVLPASPDPLRQVTEGSPPVPWRCREWCHCRTPVSPSLP